MLQILAGTFTEGRQSRPNLEISRAHLSNGLSPSSVHPSSTNCFFSRAEHSLTKNNHCACLPTTTQSLHVGLPRTSLLQRSTQSTQVVATIQPLLLQTFLNGGRVLRQGASLQNNRIRVVLEIHRCSLSSTAKRSFQAIQDPPTNFQTSSLNMPVSPRGGSCTGRPETYHTSVRRPAVLTSPHCNLVTNTTKSNSTYARKFLTYSSYQGAGQSAFGLGPLCDGHSKKSGGGGANHAPPQTHCFESGCYTPLQLITIIEGEGACNTANTAPHKISRSKVKKGTSPFK